MQTIYTMAILYKSNLKESILSVPTYNLKANPDSSWVLKDLISKKQKHRILGKDCFFLNLWTFCLFFQLDLFWWVSTRFLILFNEKRSLLKFSWVIFCLQEGRHHWRIVRCYFVFGEVEFLYPKSIKVYHRVTILLIYLSLFVDFLDT